MLVRLAVAQAQALVVLDPVGGLLGLPAGTAQKVRAAALAVLRAADDGVAVLCEGFQLARNDLARRQQAERREVFEALLAGAWPPPPSSGGRPTSGWTSPARTPSSWRRTRLGGGCGPRAQGVSATCSPNVRAAVREPRVSRGRVLSVTMKVRAVLMMP